MWSALGIQKICFLLLAFYAGVFLALHTKKPTPIVSSSSETKSNWQPVSDMRQLDPKLENNAVLKPQSPTLDHFYYQSIVPLEQAKRGFMSLYDVYLGENTGIKEVLGWLKYFFPQKNFYSSF